MKTGSEIIIDVLAEEGVETIFGYSGGAILPTYDEVFKYNEANPEKQMPLIVPSNEQGAGFMASGYARSSGKPGVVMVTSGPGATNTVTQLARIIVEVADDESGSTCCSETQPPRHARHATSLRNLASATSQLPS